MSLGFSERPDLLKDLSLEFAPGSYTLIAGPTGSGKSTLALALLGVLDLITDATVTGEITIEGVSINSATATERERLVAAVWQRPEAQLFRSTVLDEVRSGLDFRLVPASVSNVKARQALALVGLGGVDESQDPATLSGGEQQRLALAAALVLDAPVLVLDEATSALDAHALGEFTATLDRARRERPLTIIAVDHRLDAHLGRADRLLVLDDSRVALDCPPEAALGLHRSRARSLGLRIPADSAEPNEHPGPSVPGAEAGLVCREVAVALGARSVLRDLSFALPQGAVGIVTGDNGVGKSTLLRLLATELAIDSGRVSPTTRARVRAGIGYAPQRAADLLLGHTVADEVRSALTHGGGGSVGDDQIASVLVRAGLADLARSHPLRLSGGQRQRLAVALAVTGSGYGDPALVLLDEPTSAQDRTGIAQVKDLIGHADAGRTTVIASHAPSVFDGLATHYLRLVDGRLVAGRSDD